MPVCGNGLTADTTRRRATSGLPSGIGTVSETASGHSLPLPKTGAETHTTLPLNTRWTRRVYASGKSLRKQTRLMKNGRCNLRSEKVRRCSTAQRAKKNFLPSGNVKTGVARSAALLPQKPALRYIPKPMDETAKSWYTRNASGNCGAKLLFLSRVPAKGAF